MKRIALLTAKNHLIIGGGIGQFIRSFCNEVEPYAMVDIITDMPPYDSEFVTELKKKHTFICNDNHFSLATHRKKFSFLEGLSYERILNYSNSFFKALHSKMYDAVVCNDPEAFLGVAHTGIQEKIPVVFYTHNESLLYPSCSKQLVFAEYYIDILRTVVNIPNIIIGTQSIANHEQIRKASGAKSVYMPMPLPDPELREPIIDDKPDSLLYIGRHEPRKNPTLFIETVKKLGIKAKVLTTKNGLKKFTEHFAEYGISDYEILYDTMGPKKVEFIKSAKYAFHSSYQESFGFCAFETLHQMPTFLVREFEWHQNFGDMSVLVGAKTTAADIKKTMEELKDPKKYKAFVQARRDKLEVIHSDISKIWEAFFLQPHKPRKLRPNTQFAKLLDKKDYFSLTEYFQEAKRDYPSIEDISTVYNNSTEAVHILQTSSNTYFSTKGPIVLADRETEAVNTISDVSNGVDTDDLFI
jgi:glycosyltransferase involved in cell wall biosynthesis